MPGILRKKNDPPNTRAGYVAGEGNSPHSPTLFLIAGGCFEKPRSYIASELQMLANPDTDHK
jgi:hypothetical protein